MFDRILVVCAGNICRSPIAEVMLQAALPNKTVTSAGLVAKDGMAADANSIAVCAAANIDLTQHSARRINSSLCANNDLILVMEPQHQADIASRYPEVSGKVLLLGKWIGVKEIPDPHKQHIEAFEHAFSLIEQSCNEWAKRLK